MYVGKGRKEWEVGEERVGKNGRGQERAENGWKMQKMAGKGMKGQEKVGKGMKGQEKVGKGRKGQEKVGKGRKGQEKVGKDRKGHAAGGGRVGKGSKREFQEGRKYNFFMVKIPQKIVFDLSLGQTDLALINKTVIITCRVP